jgi:ABC-2 type transport system permease protein
MSTALAFVKRDASMALSYRLSFAMQFVGMLITITTFYFLSKLVGGTVATQLEAYGGDYFAFVLIGLAFSRYMMLSMTTFSTSIREGQMMGTLEIMLLSPTRLSVILLSSSIWAYVFTSFQVVLFLILGVAVFGMSLAYANYLAAMVILILSIASFAGIGIISAAFIMVLKKGDPIAFAFGALSTLLAGVYYPVQVLPGWMERLSDLLPLTYALEGMRKALLQGYTLYDSRFEILALLCFSAVLLPLAFLAFRFAVKRARAEGSLIHY